VTWNATLLARYQLNNPQLVLLVKVELTDPSTLTLMLADTGYGDNNGYWEAAISNAGRISEPGEFLDPGPQIASWSFSVPMEWFPVAGSGQDLRTMLQLYEFQEAKVTAYIGDRLSDFSLAQQVFVGYINRLEMDREEVTFHLLADRFWNTMLPLSEVTSVNYPGHPEKSRGVVLPILIGEGVAINMRDPWPGPWNSVLDQWKAGGGRPTAMGVLVDSGVAGAKAKVVVAGHRTALPVSDASQGAFIGMELLPGILSILEDAPVGGSGITSINTSTEAGFTLDDEKLIAYTAVLPIDVRITGTNPTTATNPRNALDPKNEVDFAKLDTAGAPKQLTLVLPSMAGLGTILEVKAFVAYKGPGTNTGNMRVRPLDPASGAFGTTINMTASTLGVATVLSGAWDAAWWTQQWDFGGNGAHAAIDLSIDMTGGGAAGVIEIYWACLVVKHRVALSLVTAASPARSELRGWTPPRGYRNPRGWDNKPKAINVRVPELPATYQLLASVYGAFRGLTDTAGGAYTGVNGAMVERMPDVIRALMIEVAGVSGADFETGSFMFGSFVDARFLLRFFQPDAPNVAFQLTTRTTMLDLISELCRQLGACMYFDVEDSKWRIFRWADGDEISYATAVRPEWLHMFECEKSSDVELAQGCVVRWYKDELQGRNAMETHVRSDGSGRGYNHAEFRDERFLVDTTNRHFDYVENAVNKTVTLATGQKTPMQVADQLATDIWAARANGTWSTWFGYGTQIVAGQNDVFRIRSGGIDYDCTLQEGDWSPHQLAEQVKAAIDAAAIPSRVFTCIYNDSTNEYEVKATGGTWDITVQNLQTSAWPTLGFGDNQAAIPAGNIAVTGRKVYQRKIWWMTDNWTMTPKFGSGANAATTAGPLLGWEAKDRSNTAFDIGIWQVGDLEITCAALQTKWRRKRIVDVDLWAVRSEQLAVEARRRTMQTRTRPRLIVRFSSMQVPDLKKGMVFKFSDAMDAVFPVPQLNRVSWAELRFRVVERSRAVVGARETTFTVVES